MNMPQKLQNSSMSGSFPVSPGSNISPRVLFNYETGFVSYADFISTFAIAGERLEVIIANNNEARNVENVDFGTGVSASSDIFGGEFDNDKWEAGIKAMDFRSSIVVSGRHRTMWLMMDEKHLPVAAVGVDLDHADYPSGYAFAGYRYAGDEKYLKSIVDLLRSCIGQPAKLHPGFSVADGYNQFGSFEITDTVTINEKATMNFADSEFYPWITIPIKQYFEEFFASTANVLILIGPPGTGKSTLLRTGLRDVNADATIAYKAEVVMDEKFINCCQRDIIRSRRPKKLGKPWKYEWALMKELHAKPIEHAAIVVEDADLLMKKRSDGNTRMAEILNATDGLVTREGHKFIFSTNLDNIDDIDPALLRPGRCFDVLQFGHLTYAQACAIREKKGLPIAGLVEGRKYKLAEVLNDVQVAEKRTEPVVKPRFGFNQS